MLADSLSAKMETQGRFVNLLGWMLEAKWMDVAKASANSITCLGQLLLLERYPQVDEAAVLLTHQLVL